MNDHYPAWFVALWLPVIFLGVCLAWCERALMTTARNIRVTQQEISKHIGEYFP